MDGPGRNDPCPCGSGRKHKSCCLKARETPRAPSRLHAFDDAAVDKLVAFGRKRFGSAAFSSVARSLPIGFQGRDAAFVVAWLTYVHAWDGRPLSAWLLEEGRPPPDMRDWLASQLASWLSAWEIVAIEEGRGLQLQDLLTGQRRFVEEVAASRSEVIVSDVLLARVVDHAGESVLCGTHSRVLPPDDAGGVVQAVRTYLRAQEPAVAPEQLRDPAVALKLLEAWMGAVEDHDDRAP